MPLPIVPNVTNVHDSDTSHTVIQVDAPHNTLDILVENTIENNGTETSSGSETDDSSADSE
jgi:hypothetical protein